MTGGHAVVAWSTAELAYWPSYAHVPDASADSTGTPGMSAFSLNELIAPLRREMQRVGASHWRRRMWLVIILVAVLVARRAVM